MFEFGKFLILVQKSELRWKIQAMGGSKIQGTVENGDAPTRLYISRENFPKARPPAAGTWAAGRWAALALPRTVEK